MTLKRFFSNGPPLICLLLLLASSASSRDIEGQDAPALAVKDQCENGHAPMKNLFSWQDYAVLAAMLIITCGIGIFYGCFGPKQTSSTDFLLGGSSMGTLPMAMSLAASFITAIELLGNPAEMYKHGTQFWMSCIAFIAVVPLTSKFYLPIFMNLRLTSSYEYLSMRFDSKTRIVASGLYIIQMVLYTSVAVYAPALALGKVTGLNTYVAVTVVYLVCIFYASQGGMKAVIMTDTFQALVLMGSIILVLVLGDKFVGGTGVIWSNNYQTERLEIFNMKPYLTERHTFWSVVVGGTFYWLTMFCANQATIQKYLSVETLSQARTALWVSCISLIVIYTINFYTGMVMVAHYRDCDPFRAGDIGQTDELLPHYIMTVMGHMKGIPGFFVAGIFAASLGTVAAALNSLAAVTCKDIISDALGLEMPESKGAFWGKWISIFYGVLSFALVFVVERLGSVLQVALSFNGMVGGITLGLFTLGMFFPWANSRGALFGSTIALALVMWMGFGAQLEAYNGAVDADLKETSIAGCPCLNSTAEIYPAVREKEEQTIFFLYRISYLWYSLIGFGTTIVLGVLISFMTGPQDPKEVDGDLLSPPVRQFFDSLSGSTKEVLNLPFKQCIKAHSREVQLKGIINHGLDVADEKKEEHHP